MISKRLSILGLIVTLCCSAIARGQTAQIIRHGKQTTALVVVHQGAQIGWGSAFCVSPLGFFVTNAHVIPESNVQRQVVPGGFIRQVIPGRGIVMVPRGGRIITGPVQTMISLVLNPGEADQAVYGATITKIDRSGDLAVLYITPKDPLPTLELGDVDGLFETAPITAFGYPFGQMLADKPEDYPNISVSVGRITSLRKARGELTAIQLDASLNPGNSGGPILDEKGRLIGIVEKGIPGASINFAIPVTKLAKFLEVPMASFTVTRDPKMPTKPATITMRVLAIATDAMKDATVEVELTRDNTPAETFKATKEAENLYKVTAPVVVEAEPPATQSSTQPADGSAPASDGSPATPAMTQQAAAPQLPFHQVKFAVIIKRPGKEEGRNEGTFSIPLSDAETSARLTVARNAALNDAQNNPRPVSPADPPLRPEDASAPPQRLADATPQQIDDRLVFKLPGPATKIATGGEGRFLILWMPQPRQLGIFDAQTKSLHFVPRDTDDLSLAATRDKLYMYLKKSDSIERWNLANHQQELVRPFNVAEANPNPKFARGFPWRGVEAMAAGEAGNGPVLVVLDGSIQLLDPVQMLPTGMPVDDVHAWSQWSSHAYTWASASPDGKTFIVSNLTDHHKFVFMLRIADNVATSSVGHGDVEHARVTTNGEMVIGYGGILNSGLTQIELATWKRMMPIAVHGEGYFLALEPPQFGLWDYKQFGLFASCDQSLLMTMPVPPEFSGERPDVRGEWPLPLADRIHLVPAMKVMMDLNASCTELFVRTIDLDRKLAESGNDYLFVTSAPPRFSRSAPFDYQIQVKSKQGEASFTLEDGPPGMTVSKSGRVQWTADRNSPGDKQLVLISIKDRSGKEIYYSFRLWPE